MSLKVKCAGCIWLKLEMDGFHGQCTCKEVRLSYRRRKVTDKACSYKKVGGDSQ